MIRKIARKLLGRVPPSHDGLLPRVPLASLVGEGIELRLGALIAANGNISSDELLAMCALVKSRGCQSVFEIGTFDGRTAFNFALNLPATGRVVTLDLPATEVDKTKFAVEAWDRQYIQKAASGTRFQGHAVAERITQVWGDSGTFDFGPYAGGFDLVFVDGSHSYDYVMSDSTAALGLLRNGRGMILWHDYGTPFWPGVTAALDGLAKTPKFEGLAVIEGTRLGYLIR